MTPHVLITGGFGFLGSHLVEHLLATDTCEIHIVDNLSTAAVAPTIFFKGLNTLGRVSYSVMTVREFLAQHHRPHNSIYHLASVVGPAGILPHAGRIVESVVGDAYALADAATQWKARLLDVSTSEVYGGGVDGLCSESMPKIVPAHTSVRLEYAIAKLAAETALINLCRATDLDAVIVRPFNIAGPRQSSAGGFVLPRFVESIHSSRPLTIFGTGAQIRAFTHVRDTAAGLVAAMTRGVRGEVYNLGNAANKTTILGLAERVIELAKVPAAIEFVDPKQLYGPLYEEATDKFPDPTKATRDLGWAPTHDLDAIIADTLAR